MKKQNISVFQFNSERDEEKNTVKLIRTQIGQNKNESMKNFVQRGRWEEGDVHLAKSDEQHS